MPAHGKRKYGTIYNIVPNFLLSWAGSIKNLDKKYNKQTNKQLPPPLCCCTFCNAPWFPHPNTKKEAMACIQQQGYLYFIMSSHCSVGKKSSLLPATATYIIEIEHKHSGPCKNTIMKWYNYVVNKNRSITISHFVRLLLRICNRPMELVQLIGN